MLTRRRMIGCGLAIAFAGAPAARAQRETIDIRPDLASFFTDAGVTGCFAAFDGARDTFTIFDFERAKRRYAPASTFKIVNSLIAIESGVVRDEDEVIPYGGKPQPFPAWEKDMSMREAVPQSAVPIFQHIARRVGLPLYREWLDKLDYGNGETGDVVDRFWLDGPLGVSAIEQAVFLDRLARRELPASQRAQDVAASLIKLETRNGRTLYGKTGWLDPSKPSLGWWVGWVDRGTVGSAAAGALPGDGPLAFALAMDIAAPAHAPKRLEIGKAILTKLGAW